MVKDIKEENKEREPTFEKISIATATAPAIRKIGTEEIMNLEDAVIFLMNEVDNLKRLIG